MGTMMAYSMPHREGELDLLRCMTLSKRGQKYYMDATGGDDGNDGRSPATAWQTIGKVNGASLRPGDRVLFKRGETWTLAAGLAVANGVTYADYGVGALPILDGNDSVDCVTCAGKTNVTLRNLAMIRGFDFGIACGPSGGTPASHIRIYNCVASACGNDNVIFIGGAHHCVVDGLASYDPYQRVAGPLVTCLEVSDGAHDISIRNVEGYGSPGVGISVHCHDGEAMPYNVTVKDSEFYGNAIAGIYASVLQANGLGGAARNILFEDVITRNNTTYGIYVWKDAGAAQYVDGITFRRVKSYANTNEALLMKADNVTLDHCMLVDGRVVSITDSINTKLIHCTIYNAASAIPALRISGARMAGLYGRNNIINCDVTGQAIIDISAGTGVTGLDLDYNLYFRAGGTALNTHWYYLGGVYNFANWQIQIGGDGNSPTPASPAFTNPAGDDFSLQAGSPAIDKGLEIAGVTGGYLGAAPDCGYLEKA
jgi:hypothetical protein